MLLTLSAAFLLAAVRTGAETLQASPTRDQKVVRRWIVPGDPRGVAVGADGTIYVGLAQPQAVIAVDPKSGSVSKRLVLDSAEIASTKELVTLRTSADGSRLFIANGSDESATILSLPDLHVVREITIEGEAIRDIVPDPSGRFLYLLGRRVHVYDGAGETELHVLPVEDPMAIAVASKVLAVIATEDFGNARATSVALYETATFREIGREPLETEDRIQAALVAQDGQSLVAVSANHFFEAPLTRGARKMTANAKGQMTMAPGFGDLVNSSTICLPEKAGPEIVAAGPERLVFFGERRCSTSGAFTGSSRHVTPASLYGVDAYALAFDARSATVVVTASDGSLTIYKLPDSHPRSRTGGEK